MTFVQMSGQGTHSVERRRAREGVRRPGRLYDAPQDVTGVHRPPAPAHSAVSGLSGYVG